MLDRPRADSGESDPFAAFERAVLDLAPSRAAIAAATRRDERAVVRDCLPLAALSPAEAQAAEHLARDLVERLRADPQGGLVEGLLREFALSSQEGVALMCLAEALLRIPDTATRDALIRDKIAHGDWRAHLGRSPSLFVNAATWGLLITGRLTATRHEEGLAAALSRLLARGGEPLIRGGVDLAMRLLGQQFVTGRTIAEALANSREREHAGFTYSYDMLGEAAMTADDAARYLASYEDAIAAIGHHAGGRGVVAGPGISVKLSALHPRYERAQRDRVMAELLPRLAALARAAKACDIGLNIDAEESDRLDLSLDLLEALLRDPALAGWEGLGFVVQAYGRRALPVIEHLDACAVAHRRRLMVRLVKGAYWDSEIKRAQVEGQEDFPVFTRKAHTDVSYLACARRLLAARERLYPQFATHNAHTLAAVIAMAGPAFAAGDYEFQCLHGMGEPLYDQVVGAGGLARPCRIYAPVGSHETLLAYLVRRLLENGANTSFVNRIADPALPVAALIADPVQATAETDDPGSPHPAIAAPPALYGTARRNARGLDLAHEPTLASLAAACRASAREAWAAAPPSPATGPVHAVTNPADRRDRVGEARWATAEDVRDAVTRAAAAVQRWAGTPVADRATVLRRAADALEARMMPLIGLVVREAGKTLPNAVAELREAIDFLRYYAAEAERTLAAAQPLGPVACIAPWNFPLAILTGQLAAALAAGNTVLAKPAEETPLVAAALVAILHDAGVPADVLQLLPGDGAVGASLTADPRVMGVLFTGSGAAACQIARTLAGRLDPLGRPVPLIAETGGQNAMIVDSSALPEQVVADVITSAFDSAGQRCSALRILCLQEEIADRTLAMLRGALAERTIGRPDRLATDIGPVITEAARDALEAHVAGMAARGHRVERWALPPETAEGVFVAPTLIAIARVADVEQEVFGPVLHVLRFRRPELPALIEAINATGYALTAGLHTRIDETVAEVTARIDAGNLYVNRSMIGATVGVQPFGGSGLSGTGPKAGGPLLLARLVTRGAASALAAPPAPLPQSLVALLALLRGNEDRVLAEAITAIAARVPPGSAIALPGPVGESNSYRLRPRGRIGLDAHDRSSLLLQLAVTLATGNTAVLRAAQADALRGLPPAVTASLITAPEWTAGLGIRLLLSDREGEELAAMSRVVASWPGPIVTVMRCGTAEHHDPGLFDPCRLFDEVSVSTNTAAAGGNASLMTIG